MQLLTVKMKQERVGGGGPAHNLKWKGKETKQRKRKGAGWDQGTTRNRTTYKGGGAWARGKVNKTQVKHMKVITRGGK